MATKQDVADMVWEETEADWEVDRLREELEAATRDMADGQRAHVSESLHCSI